MKSKSILLLILVSVLILNCGPGPKETALKTFIENHVEKIEPLYKAANIAYWEAAISGADSLYDTYSKMELKIRKIYSDSTDYAFLNEMKKSGKVRNPLLARQLDVLLNTYLENQVDPDLLEAMVTLSSSIEQKFSTFRGIIDGKHVSTNEINEILKNATVTKTRKKAWLASKQVGPVVAQDIIKLVKLRNQAAQKLGFDNYHTMVLHTGEQDVDNINQIFDELFGFTSEPFENLKTELDKILADLYKVSPEKLMPWHYHDSFFQESPLVYDINLDHYYQDKDIEALAAEFYKGIGLPVEGILKRSDLYEKDGKNPHAFCTDIDREGDVRILCNIKPTERWMETMLHELGHGVYDKYMDMKVPYLLRQPAHTFTTEAIAMLFGRLSRDGMWMQEMLHLTDSEREEIDKVSEKYAQLKQLIFARWAMVMFKFEQELYGNPDQDLNTLWWNLKARYQLLQKPEKRDEPDWASKIHFTIAPCYYHNYLLGELLASQLHYKITTDILDEGQTGYVGQKSIGNFLRTRVFEQGAVKPWNAMIEQATGEPLNSRYFVEQFVK